MKKNYLGIVIIIVLQSLVTLGSVNDRNISLMLGILGNNELMTEIRSKVSILLPNEMMELKSLIWNGTSGGPMTNTILDNYLITFDNFGHTSQFPFKKCMASVLATTDGGLGSTTYSVAELICK